MLDQETLRKIKSIQLRARFMATEILAGAYESAFKGQGMEFDEVREYSPGDDLRTINWRVTARMQAPYVKVLREERELTLLLMVDVSASLRLGTTSQTKQDIAAELAAVLAYLAIRNQDKVGLLVFSDHVERYIPPRKGRSHVWQIIRAVLNHERGRHATNIAAAAEYAQRMLKRRSTIFLLSDFMCNDWQKRLRQLSARHDVVGVSVTDPREYEMPACGLIDIYDSESGRKLVLDSSSPKQRQAFARHMAASRRQLVEELRQMQIDHFEVSTAREPVHDLQMYFQRRDNRRRRSVG